ncbi:hypothetical protein EDD66_11267 [Mobilisporobacter senegalensis]|uniref:Uncharacterized protein n=1 Tax=Mobilisporobacter senegalensis TaxID=1329262 RepID=A0A3N1XB11_9FIRM|nr:DUF6323 family protein [Mobilisporobacter senegalensis]ROR23936.1 hypothetical protein EDD66_11267 [Mobilisporobacter senegalensis]
MDGDIFELMQQKKQENEIIALISCNDQTEQFGLTLTQEEAKELIISRNDSLKLYQRVEFSSGILEKLIYNFCDSMYINQDNYADTLATLQDIFYMFKNEAEDKLTDDELMAFMKEQFESVCAGDTDYLAETCLERFAQAIRAGYTGFIETEGYNEYEKFSEEQRWDKDLYMQVLKELFWR